MGAAEEQWKRMDFESRALLSEVLLARGATHIKKELFEEADFNNEINYYYR